MSDAFRAMPPALLICGFGPFPAAPSNPAAHAIESLRDRRWSPHGARAAYAILPTRWDDATPAVNEAMADCGCAGVLLVGVAVGSAGFRVEMRAQNRTSATRVDACGLPLGRDRIDPTGPAVARVTAPVAEMVQALRDEGLPVAPSSDAGSYLCNYTLYRVLTGYAARSAPPLAGFLHVPQAAELAPGAASTLEAVERGVRAAASAFARALDRVRSLEPA